MWQDQFFIQHVAIEGLATAGGIQGTIADACLMILKHHDITPIMKWVDDLVFLWSPITSPLNTAKHTFAYDLSKKGQKFQFSVTYVSFLWDLATCHVSVPHEKHLCALAKVDDLLSLSMCTVSWKSVTSAHGTLQHLMFIYCDGRHALSSISSFLADFQNDFVTLHLLHTV